MLDERMESIRNLFEELDRVEEEMNRVAQEMKMVSQEGKQDEYNSLRKKEKSISKNIKAEIKKLREEISFLEENKDNNLYDILKEIEKFIRECKEESPKLCIKIKEYKQGFLMDKELKLDKLYSKIWKSCGFKD